MYIHPKQLTHLAPSSLNCLLSKHVDKKTLKQELIFPPYVKSYHKHMKCIYKFKNILLLMKLEISDFYKVIVQR